MINPYEQGCGRDIYSAKKGNVYCGDSEGYICKQCEYIKELIKLVDSLLSEKGDKR